MERERYSLDTARLPRISHFNQRIQNDHGKHDAAGTELNGVTGSERHVRDARSERNPDDNLDEFERAEVSFARGHDKQQVSHIAVQVRPGRVAEDMRYEPPP